MYSNKMVKVVLKSFHYSIHVNVVYVYEFHTTMTIQFLYNFSVATPNV